MIESDLTNTLLAKTRRADSVIRTGMKLLILLNVILLISVLYQMQRYTEKIQMQDVQNHKRTQEYVKCIGEALLVPLDKRDEKALDNCTNKADSSTKEAK